MADHFLSKLRVAGEDFVEAGGQTVLDRYGALKALLTERAGPEVAALFAEPLISRGNDAAPPTVSWYGETAGEARPLDQLPPGERERAERYLADHLRPVRAIAEAPGGELAMGALTTYGAADVLVAGGKPVIVNWGLMPGGKGANAAARPAHYAATLGRFLPLDGARPAAGPAPRSTPAAALPPPEVQVRRVVTPLAWVPLLLLLLLAGGVLAWLLMPGTRLFHAGTPPVVTEAAQLAAARAETAALDERRAQLQAALDGAVCRADGQLILPDGRTPEGLLPPALGEVPADPAEAAPDALLPSRTGRVLVPGEDGTLLALIEARTVMVLAADGGGKVSTGSGFVAGPGLIVTNHHVIAAALGEGGQILVASAALDGAQAATLVKSQGPLAETGGDFALLKIENTDLPAFEVLVPGTSLKLTNVVAAGYPGDVLETDAGFAALKRGEAGAVPGLTVTDGIVNTEQQFGPETHVLMHSAALSTGNSGGPLVDMCGRLVGVNSFVRQGALQNRGFALTTGDLMAFLNGTPAAPGVAGTPCAPVVARPGLARAGD